MIQETLFNNLPTFIETPEMINHRLSYVYPDGDFMPFTKLNDQATLFRFSNILASIGLPSDSQMAILFHELTEPTRLHFHDYIELCYIAKGRLLHIIGHEPIIINEGDLCIIPENQQHLLAPLDQASPLIINCLIHPDLLRKINQLSRPLALFDSHHTSLTTINLSETSSEISFQQLIVDYIQNNFHSNLTVIGSFIHFLSRLQHADTRSHSLSKNPLVMQCLQIIKANPITITQKGLAEKVNFSPSYLSRLIKKATGKTISVIIAEEKMRFAQHLLATTNYPITTIANQAGYSSESHFYRLFKQHYSITPKHYRELMTK
ncbi:helix-turn-helix domain-containing protein [Tuanshanicoccus lijuaniae]|uniref:AraC family transcriptional regulator n=1 Tax=Aerococcaceae bacterium zg-1292 TaxID=2774330 RepID=UPI00193602AA|nr:helix-turn-helix domain-containing protein [Aerococcaceae bacterium zg-1292]MBF6979119.1 helix-turn-helix domain-containing protein [Aerococcaceae bacterium zg-BR22]MBS4455767.1 helix-turn-helix domain-containing protein [Aerococcaceae bacterium zg-A91]MBS4457518.1 helix-turn-helix domain-containing protein [Aerococcaceae bacterium zg-BR33]QQA37041.1 helix-turn-helix domain-containing protein [Aerococcaceae bacterium zg-1292]